ncbi:single-stranded DNA-binding protein Ssb 1 [Rhizobium etli 8C-3]|uniref:Single-stranded DNA-binding protein n=1 Tax=Rhizobium etli 8C-3 TaxID=538025 RepID=A0A1L5P2B8_RHIET|nr:single-stranded DNA-binding protein [Rhizobium etli]APO74236.1 single-stranded DNA-binding protein Ssb 1 [Rhizobium etli 8C-3]
MAGSVNKVILLGHLGADPEIRRTQDGRSIASIRLATSESWRDRTSGERREKTEWHSIVVFAEPLVKLVEQFVKKGSKIYVEGQLQTRKWQDRDGQDRYSTEIVLQGFNTSIQLLDKREGSGYRAGGDGPGDYGLDGDRATRAASGSSGAPANFSRDMDDDIPFAPEWRG